MLQQLLPASSTKGRTRSGSDSPPANVEPVPPTNPPRSAPPQNGQEDLAPPFEPDLPPRKRRRGVTLEEVPDEEALPNGRVVESHPSAGWTYRGVVPTEWETRRSEDERDQHDPWFPFDSLDDWELARWLMTSGVSQEKIDGYLKLHIVCLSISLTFMEVYANGDKYHLSQTRAFTQPSSRNKAELLKRIDTLPRGPDFSCSTFVVTGDLRDESTGRLMTEEIKLWMRDPVECVRELLGNAGFRDHVVFEPSRVFVAAGGERIYDEMWTGDWWWDVQVRVQA